MHTPGPWAVHESAIYDSDGFEIAAVDEEPIRLNWDSCGYRHWSEAEGVTFKRRSEKEVDANARLIAAAPELLEACKAMLDQLSHGRDLSEGAYADMMTRARAAIAKAEPAP
jgi:hypothetical protein